MIHNIEGAQMDTMRTTELIGIIGIILLALFLMLQGCAEYTEVMPCADPELTEWYFQPCGYKEYTP